MQNLHSGQNRNDYSLVASDAVATGETQGPGSETQQAVTQQPVATTHPLAQPVGNNRIEPPSNLCVTLIWLGTCASMSHVSATILALAGFKLALAIPVGAATGTVFSSAFISGEIARFRQIGRG